jgi:hypothetical protein
VNFAENARQTEKYHNRRTELAGLAVDFFSNGGCLPSSCRDIALELEAYEYTLDARRRIQLISKKEMKKKMKLGVSPDLADAFLLSLADPLGMFRLNTSVNALNDKATLLSRELISAGKWKAR